MHYRGSPPKKLVSEGRPRNASACFASTCVKAARIHTPAETHGKRTPGGRPLLPPTPSTLALRKGRRNRMLPKGLPLYHTEPQPDTSQLLLPFTLNLKTHANQLFWRRAPKISVCSFAYARARRCILRGGLPPCTEKDGLRTLTRNLLQTTSVRHKQLPERAQPLTRSASKTYTRRRRPCRKMARAL